MNIIIFGAPGAGKGSLARGIMEKCRIKHISTGDILRESVNLNNELGKNVREYVESGRLVPDDIMIEIIKSKLCNPENKKGFILDGFPRTIAQTEAFNNMLEDNGRKIDVVFNMVVSDDTLIERLSGRRVCPKCFKNYHIKNMPPKIKDICDDCAVKLIIREDDKAEVIRERIKTYKEQSQPIIDYYRDKNLIKNINAEQDLKEMILEVDDYLKV